MKKQAWLVLAIGGFLVLLGASRASAGSLVLRADVPFDFSAGNKVLPAGRYELWYPFESHSVLQFRDHTGRGIATVRTNDLSTPAIQKETRLIFNRYDDRYFLNRVLISGQAIGSAVIQSSQERDSAKERAQRGAGGPESTSVAAFAH